MSSILDTQAICLKLDEDSDGFNQFKEFFFVSATPFVYFVNQNGKMCEPITGNTISEAAIKEQFISYSFYTLRVLPTVENPYH